MVLIANTPVLSSTEVRAVPSPGAYRNDAIDALRGLAALVVMGHHLPVTPNQFNGAAALTSLDHIASFGYLGVPVFFVISGCCIGRAWLRADNPLEFAGRRLRRLLPPYWGSILVVFAVAAATKLVMGTNDVAVLPGSVGELAKLLALINYPLTSVLPVNTVYWSLTYEIAFYGILAAALTAPRRFRVPLLTGVSVLAALGCLLLPLRAGVPWFFMDQWPLFALGLAEALRWESPHAARALTGVALLHAIGWGLGWIPSLAIMRASGGPAPWVGVATWLLLRHGIGRLPTWRPLVWIGGFSYSLYLIHLPLGLALTRCFLPAVQGDAAGAWATRLLIWALVIAAAWAFAQVAERPFMRKPAPTVV